MNKTRVAGIVLIIGSLLGLAFYVLWMETRNLDPLVEPISLTPGHKLYTFKTDITHSYGIQLEFSHLRVPYSEIACALGINLTDPRYPPVCGHHSRTLNLAWTLSTDGKTVLHAPSNSEYLGSISRNGSATRYLDVFEGKGGQTYTLNVDIKADARLLSDRDPVLRVEVGALYEERLSVYFVLSLALALALVIIGSLMFIFGRPAGRGVAMSPPSTR